MASGRRHSATGRFPPDLLFEVSRNTIRSARLPTPRDPADPASQWRPAPAVRAASIGPVERRAPRLPGGVEGRRGRGSTLGRAGPGPDGNVVFLCVSVCVSH